MHACSSVASSLSPSRTDDTRRWIDFHEEKQGISNLKRVRINVRGMRFETFESTFERFPETLLGSSEKRTKYYDPIRDEYRLDRDRQTFDAILFYYQSRGILCRPEHVPSDIFNEELKFYEINDRRFPVLDQVRESSKKPKSELTWREKGWELLENPESSTTAKYLSFFSIIVIIMSLVTYCLETVPRFKRKTTVDFSMQQDYWLIMESIWITWFTIEYLLRFLLSPNRLRFLITPFGLIDLVAIIPFYIALFLQDGNNSTSLYFVRLLRVGRCLRLFKLSRYSSSTMIVAAAIRDSQEKLRALTLCTFITVTFFSSAIYYVEQFSEKSQFQSIPDTFYYTIITMVTVGYGDYVPQTVVGRMLGSLCAYSGIIILYCFPTPIIVMRFVQLYKEHVIKEMEKSGKDTAEVTNQFNGNVYLKK